MKVGSWSYTFCQLAVSSLSVIAFFVGLLRSLLSFIFVHLLAREVQDSVTIGFSTQEGVEQKFLLNICINFCKTVQLDTNQQFCWISKDNSTILRQFKNFLIPLRTDKYFSYQEMNIFVLKSAISRQAKASKLSLVLWLNEIVGLRGVLVRYFFLAGVSRLKSFVFYYVYLYQNRCRFL